MTDPAEAATPDPLTTITQLSVVAFFAADHVALTPDSKLYINGGFIELLRFPVFPATLPTLGVAAVLEVPFHESTRDHVIRIGLRDSESRSLPVMIEANFRTAPSLEAQFGEPSLLPFGVTVPNVEFPNPGIYHLVLSVDNKEIQTYRMRAVQTPLGTTPPFARPD